MNENSLKDSISALEFCIYYQPKYSLIDKNLVGFEALGRVAVHSNYSNLISFGAYEQTIRAADLSVEYTQKTIQQTITKLIDFKKKNLKHTISVNVSLSVIASQKTNLYEFIFNRFKFHDLDLSRLTLEIIEVDEDFDKDRASCILNALSQCGVNLSIDDFGTGFNAFSRLLDFPFNELKVDRSFVSNIETSKKSLKIVDGIIKIAKSLDLCVVAEGIETLNQQRILEELGCDVVQGFFYSRAMPSNLVDNFIINSSDYIDFDADQH